VPRWATLFVVLALIAALAVAALLAIGSRPRLPAPFGPAKNGLVAFDDGGQLYVAKADGSASLRPVASPGQFPTWSHDGTKLAFLRSSTRSAPFSLWVVNTDGSSLTNLTKDLLINPPGDPTNVAWSPDG